MRSLCAPAEGITCCCSVSIGVLKGCRPSLRASRVEPFRPAHKKSPRRCDIFHFHAVAHLSSLPKSVLRSRVWQCTQLQKFRRSSTPASASVHHAAAAGTLWVMEGTAPLRPRGAYRNLPLDRSPRIPVTARTPADTSSGWRRRQPAAAAAGSDSRAESSADPPPLSRRQALAAAAATSLAGNIRCQPDHHQNCNHMPLQLRQLG